MESEPLISNDVLARYAQDAASEVSGVSALGAGSLHRGQPVLVTETDSGVDLAVHLELEWGASAGAVGKAVQQRVSEYVERMTGTKVGAVDVVVERVSAPPG